MLPWVGQMSSAPVLAIPHQEPRCLGQRSRLSELPIKERSSLPMFSSPLWPPIEPNGPFALRRRSFWPLFLTNRQAPKTSPVELHPRGEAPRRTYYRASRRELPSSGCRPSKQYARLMPILLTNCGIGRDDTAGRAFPPELILRPTCPLGVIRKLHRPAPP